jgi:hypothetical protein
MKRDKNIKNNATKIRIHNKETNYKAKISHNNMLA